MSIGRFLVTFLGLYQTLLFVYIILSWFAGGNSALRGIYDALGVVCEPYLAIFRRFMPPLMLGSGGLDLSPLVGLFVLQIVSNLLGGLLR